MISKEIENNADRDVLVYLVGNRADLGDTDQREVTKEDGIAMMREIGLDHAMETSALTGYNVASLFEILTKHLFLENSNKLSDFREESADTQDQGRGMSITLKMPKRNESLYSGHKNSSVKSNKK